MTRTPFLPAALATALLASLTAGLAPAALAQSSEEGPKTIPAESCFPIEGIRKTLVKMESLKESRRDTVQATMGLSFELEPGEAMPERLEFRDAGRVLPVVLNADNESVGLKEQMLEVSEAAELCNVDPAREGRLRGDRGYTQSFSLAVRFIDTPGTHTLEELEDGTKDGRAHYKKMAGAMGFMVPKFDHVAVAGNDDDAPPRLFATRNGQDVGELTGQLMNNGRLVPLDAIEEMDADGLRVDAPDGYYRLSPSPDAKTVEKFMN